MPSVQFNAVSKYYRGCKAVRGLNFTAASNRVTVILGPSGAGKTTILRLIAGFEKPDTGEILLNDLCVASKQHFVEPRKRKIGMVFQDLALWPHWTILKNITFVMEHEKHVRKEQTLAFLDMVNMRDKAYKYPGELSGGEKQRVAIVRALAAEPEILLLDEPFSNLEKSLRERLLEELKTLLAVKMPTVIYVTHNQEEGFSIADRVIIMKDGIVHQEGEKEEVYYNPHDVFTATFLGYKTFVTRVLPGLPDTKNIQSPNGKIFAYRPDDVTVLDQPGDWTVTGCTFKDGKWLSRAEHNNVTAYAHTQRFMEPGARISIQAIKQPSLVLNE
jgi:iron(III) transport system ATP-binding protein